MFVLIQVEGISHLTAFWIQLTLTKCIVISTGACFKLFNVLTSWLQTSFLWGKQALDRDTWQIQRNSKSNQGRWYEKGAYDLLTAVFFYFRHISSFVPCCFKGETTDSCHLNGAQPKELKLFLLVTKQTFMSNVQGFERLWFNIPKTQTIPGLNQVVFIAQTDA